MSKQRPRSKPRRLFRHRPLSPHLLAGIEAVTEADPTLRPALTEAVAAIDDAQFLAAVVRLPIFARTTLLLSWKDAVFGLRSGGPCDLCRQAPARHIRLLGVGPGSAAWLVPAKEGDQCFIGFPAVCAACFRRPASELVGRLLREHGDVIRQMVATPFRRPAVIGLKIGQAGDLGHRPVLESCFDCTETVWIDQTEVDRLAPEMPMHLCPACALKRSEAGRLEAVPLFMPCLETYRDRQTQGRAVSPQR